MDSPLGDRASDARHAPFSEWVASWARTLRFAGTALAATLAPASYTAATRAVTVRQIYFTAWQILPLFLLFSALLSFIVIRIIVNAAGEFGLELYALELVLRGIVLELTPLLTALFVALRSGAAIATEIALMRVWGELDEMERAGEEPLRRQFVPRVAGAALSVISLTAMSCALTVLIAYLGQYGLSPWGFEEFTRTVGKIFDLPTLAGFALKCTMFGAAVAVIPISAGLEADARLKSAPVAVLGGMMRLFFVLGMIEGVSLAARYV
jgi:phospholipid/cholesterol/gamma-HCH transport system permease protein